MGFNYSSGCGGDDIHDNCEYTEPLFSSPCNVYIAVNYYRP